MIRADAVLPLPATLGRLSLLWSSIERQRQRSTSGVRVQALRAADERHEMAVAGRQLDYQARARPRSGRL